MARLRLLQADDDVAVHHRAACARTCAERGSGRPRRPRTRPVHSGNGCGEPMRERARGRCGSFRLRAPDLDRRACSALTALATPVMSPPPPMPRNHGSRVGCVLQDLQSHRRVPGDEVVVVEGMDERAVDAWDARSSSAFHATSIGHGNQLRAERAHALAASPRAPSRSRRPCTARRPVAPRRRRPGRRCRR